MGERGARMQADVLAILQGANTPQSAYDVLDALRPAHPKIAPPTVYRALNALIQAGHAHKLESLNAFVACQHHDHAGAAVMSICGDCGLVEEAVSPKLMDEISSLTSQSGFSPKRHVVEVHGRCASCDTEEPAS